MEKIERTQADIENMIAQNESEKFTYSYTERGEYRLVVKGINEVSEFETTPILMDVSFFDFCFVSSVLRIGYKSLNTAKIQLSE